MVVDRNGLPLGVYELPYMADLNAVSDQRELLENLLRDSQRGFHQALNINVDANLLAHNHGLDIFDDWQYFIRRAAERRHVVLGLHEMIAFHLSRSRASMQSRIRERVDSRGRPTEGAILQIEVLGHDGRHWVRVPRRWGEWRLRETAGYENTLDGLPDGDGVELETRNETVFGQEVTLIRLTADIELVEVVYR
jgi:hypothetical protein